jgi:hypothetical protein
VGDATLEMLNDGASDFDHPYRTQDDELRIADSVYTSDWIERNAEGSQT